MRSFVLVAALLASTVSARNSKRTTCPVKSPVVAPPTCDVAAKKPTLPENQTQLVLPAGQVATKIWLGVGTQNYTCDATTSKFVSAGALAKLYDVACEDQTTYSTIAHDNFLSAAADLKVAFEAIELEQVGDHYFASYNGTNSPVFDERALRGKADATAFVVVKRAGGVDVPASTEEPKSSVALLQLSAVDASIAPGTLCKTVFRLDTQGGTAAPLCTAGETSAVAYTAIYWCFA